MKLIVPSRVDEGNTSHKVYPKELMKEILQTKVKLKEVDEGNTSDEV